MDDITGVFEKEMRILLVIFQRQKSFIYQFVGLYAFIAGGFNRLSIGVQSMIDGELKLLGRLHKAEDAKRAVCDARLAGFKNISVDDV